MRNTASTTGRCILIGCLLILASFHVTDSHAQSVKDKQPIHNVRFKHYLTGIEDGLNINAITAITQDQQGFIWIGGEDGLVRFNGKDFELFRHELENPNSLSSSYIWDLAVDQRGALWVATGKGLTQFDGVLHQFSRYTTAEPGPNIEAADALPEDVIFCLAFDKKGTLWIGTAGGLYYLSPSRERFEKFEALNNEAIRELYIDKKNTVWIGTSSLGLVKYLPHTQEIKFWSHKPGQAESLPHNYVRAIAQDKLGRLWVGTLGGGIAQLSVDEETFTRFQHIPGDEQSLPKNSVWDLHLDKHGDFWVTTDPGGLSLFDPQTGVFRSFSHSDLDPRSIHTDKARAIFDDFLGDIWVGGFPAGVSYFNRATAVFENVTRSKGEQSILRDERIATFYKDRHEQVWVGSEGGVNVLDAQSKTLSAPPWADKVNKPVLSITEDNSSNLWLGTWSGGLYRVNQSDNKVQQYVAGARSGLKDAYIWSLLYDSQNRLWAGTENHGLHLYLPEQDRFIHFEYDPQDPGSLSFNHVWVLMEDSRKQLWVGTIDGLDVLESLDGSKAQFRHYQHDPEDENTLSSNRILSLFEDRDGDIWVGTQGGGLNRLQPESGDVLRLGLADGLPSANISSIQQDREGYIWVSTLNGIARINKTSLEIRIFTESDGLPGNSFNRNASLSVQNELYFGGTSGFTIFNPEHLPDNTFEVPLLVTDFRILNTSIFPGTDSPLSKSIVHTKSIELNYQHSMLAFDFYALDYRSPSSTRYVYMLEGFDKDWNQVGNKNSATYTNLDPGDYIFKVRASNKDGVWSEYEPQIELFIAPPPWQTWWAYVIYSLFFLAALILLFLSHKKKIEFKNQRALNERLVKVDRMKDAFLANTSHELRTPLNGIIGLAESMLDGASGDISSGVRYNLKMISGSGRRLSNLINDILDYSKLNERKLQVAIRPLNLGRIVEEVFELLEPLIGKKDLKLINEVPDEVFINGDPDRMQQVLVNLVGNAIKFSLQGHVKVRAEKHEDYWMLQVADTGPGIETKDQKKIFEAFTQLDEEETRSQGGTGLGLAITKQLVELQGGTIKVESELGKGACFTVTLRACSSKIGEHVSRSAVVGETGHEKLNRFVDTATEETLTLLKPGEMCRDYTVMIVDDDAINRMVLNGILSLQDYQVIEADSGIDALQLLKTGRKIDLIILDVMMPKMSGYEACMRIRADYPVHVLPILFLTAKNFSDDLVRGFVAGGNDFLTKPVSKHELLSRVSTHLSLLDVNRKLEKRCQESQFQNIITGRELTALGHIVDTINREMDFRSLLKEVLTDVMELIEADHVIYWQVDQSGHRFCVAAEVGNQSGQSEICVPDAMELDAHLDDLYVLGHSIVVLEEFGDPRLDFVAKIFNGCKSSLLMTIYFENKVVGFITVVNYVEEQRFTENTIDTLDRVRAHITSAVVKASLLEKLNLNTPQL